MSASTEGGAWWRSLRGGGEVAATVRVVLASALVLLLSSGAVEVLVDRAPAPIATVIDDFDRAAGPLGVDGASLRWEAPGWQIDGGVARATGGGASGPTLAVTVLDAAPAVVGATLVNAPAGTGLVFRYVDADNYWAVLPVAMYSTWELRSVIDGVSSRRGRSILASGAPGTNVEVHADSTAVHLFVEGRQVAKVESTELADGTGIGFRGVEGTAWDRLLIVAR